MSAADRGSMSLNLNEESDSRIPLSPDREIEIHYSKEFFSKNGLFKWVDAFELGTAGYRDTFNMEDFFSTDAPFNAHTVMIIAEAMARIYNRRGYRSIHIGGEVRRYTPQIIEYIGRIFASHSISVHLNGEKATTPIWASSFGVFFNELDGGANVTASHSQSFKQGLKPMDDKGMQLLDMADEIREEVRRIGREVAGGDFLVRLSRSDSPHILQDFHYIEPYVNYLTQIIPKEAFELIRKGQDAGMRVGVSTVGGSMHENSVPVFEHFGIDTGDSGSIRYMHSEKRDDFHRVGMIQGEDHGCDPTKAVIYRNIGLKERLVAGEIDFGFIWDPDGDRYNIVTLADGSLAEEASDMGLEVESVDGAQVVVYFKPNQIYFLIAALKLEMLARSGELFEFDQVIATTYPTSRSIAELADAFNRKYSQEFGKKGTKVRAFHTPVGFKYFGGMVGELEEQVRRGGEVVLTDATGRKVSLGSKPRILIMAEESGGAAMGSSGWTLSRTGRRQSLAMKEKDGMQLALMNLSVMAKLYLEKNSFARLYMDKIKEYDIVFRYYERIDKKLFEESLRGEEREKAQAVGNRAKEYMVETFRSFTGGMSTEEVQRGLQSLVGGAVAIPEIHRVFWAGDGTYIDFGSFWFELRASGTDAVLRFYIEGKDKTLLNKVNQAFVAIAERKIEELRAGSAHRNKRT